MKGTSCCVIRRNLSRVEPLSAWFPLLYACRFVEFDTSVICHVFVHCFGPGVWLISMIARYVFKRSKYLLLRDKIWRLLWTCCLLAFYTVAPGPVVIRTVTTVGRFLSRVSYLPSYVFLQRRRSFTSGKLYACLQKFLCFLQVSDRAYVSGAPCIGLFLLSSFWYHSIQM